jgi:hypothetical protein
MFWRREKSLPVTGIEHQITHPVAKSYVNDDIQTKAIANCDRKMSAQQSDLQ